MSEEKAHWQAEGSLMGGPTSLRTLGEDSPAMPPLRAAWPWVGKEPLGAPVSLFGKGEQFRSQGCYEAGLP